jgi:tRNA (guanine37-N1)-methyltransferase
MRFDIITIFPQIIEAYLNESIIKRACEHGLLDIRVHDLRVYANDKHKTVDDRPFGGGPGMVMKLEPIIRAINAICGSWTSANIAEVQLPHIIILSAGGKQFNAKKAQSFSKKYNHIIVIAGHYEGIDARLQSVIRNAKFTVQEISIGPYVLTGGELPALVVLDAISRHIPGVLGREESLEEARYGVGTPAYTRPEIFEYNEKKYPVPKILVSGNHKKITTWRSIHRKASF